LLFQKREKRLQVRLMQHLREPLTIPRRLQFGEALID
jgi:hypothetical protein